VEVSVSRSFPLLPRLAVAFLVAAAVSSAPRLAGATGFGFNCITNNNAADCAIGVSQLHLDASAAGAGQVRFELTNSGPAQSTIAGAYWDDDSSLLASIASISSAGVSFSANGSPPDLPGGNSINPAFSGDFRVNANAPPPQNGVNPGDVLDVVFNLANGVSANDVINALGSGSLRVGVHVINFASGGSESFVNTPEPAALLLGALGLAGLAAFRRRA
jgi:hypothetical protein